MMSPPPGTGICGCAQGWQVRRVNFGMGSAGNKAEDIGEVQKLTAAAGEIFDLQTGTHLRA